MIGRIIGLIILAAKCSSLIAQEKIVGGRTAIPIDWQFIVRFEQVGCAGTIITPHWVVTAAHCVLSEGQLFEAAELSFIIRESNPYAIDATEATVYPNSVFVHPDYDHEDNLARNDIALLFVEEKISIVQNFSLYIPNSDHDGPKANTICRASGWGVQEFEGNELSHTLLEVDLPVLSPSTCFRYLSYAGYDSASQICAGWEEGGRDSCQGDSGGPLVCPERASDNSTKIVLHGIISIGYGCALPKTPGLYTRVHHFFEWMDTIIQNQEKEQMGVSKILLSNLTEIVSDSNAGSFSITSYAIFLMSLLYLNMMT